MAVQYDKHKHQSFDPVALRVSLERGQDRYMAVSAHHMEDFGFGSPCVRDVVVVKDLRGCSVR